MNEQQFANYRAQQIHHQRAGIETPFVSDSRFAMESNLFGIGIQSQINSTPINKIQQPQQFRAENRLPSLNEVNPAIEDSPERLKNPIQGEKNHNYYPSLRISGNSRNDDEYR